MHAWNFLYVHCAFDGRPCSFWGSKTVSIPAWPARYRLLYGRLSTFCTWPELTIANRKILFSGTFGTPCAFSPLCNWIIGNAFRLCRRTFRWGVVQLVHFSTDRNIGDVDRNHRVCYARWVYRARRVLLITIEPPSGAAQVEPPSRQVLRLQRVIQTDDRRTKLLYSSIDAWGQVKSIHHKRQATTSGTMIVVVINIHHSKGFFFVMHDMVWGRYRMNIRYHQPEEKKREIYIRNNNEWRGRKKKIL